MKKQAQRVSSFVLVLMIVFSCFNTVIPIKANAKSITVFSQTDSRWGSHYYGYSDTACTKRATISSGGCGILSFVNAVYYLNGNFIEPIMLADWSVSHGYRINGQGTSHGLYKAFADANGSQYGIKYSGQTSSYSTLRDHLIGGGVAVGSVPGHLMAIVDYDSSTGKYLILDSYKSSNRHTQPNGYTWETENTLKNTYKLNFSVFIMISNTSSTPTPVPQDPYVDLGTDFYATIEHQSTGMLLTNQDHNVVGAAKSGRKEQVWRFERQSNGAYKIESAYDNSVMDVSACADEDGTNIYTYSEYVGGMNQQFFIYYRYDACYLRPAHSQNRMVDMSLSDHNVALWGKGDDWEPQEFNINMISYKVTADPLDMGTDFYANIEHLSTGLCLTNQQDNIAGETRNGGKNQVWRFERLSNGAYKIESALDNSVMDILANSNEDGANIYAYKEYVGGLNQQFFIYYMYDAYYLRPANSYDKMVDLDLEGHNVALWVKGDDWAPQEFKIDKISYKVTADPLDMGTDFYANIEHLTTGLCLTNQQNNIAGEPRNGSKNQVWKFDRQANGAYKIQSALDNSVMDVYANANEDGTNIYAYKEYVAGLNQQFYIYYMYDAYYLRPASSYDKMVDMALDDHNVALWIYGEDWEPQEFKIDQIYYKVSADPIDLGTKFYANIEHQSTGLYLTNQQDNIAGEAKNGTKSQEWKFERQENGAYKIESMLNNAVMDVYANANENGTNIYAYKEFVGGLNQQFFIYRMYDAYYLRPANSYDKMVDMALDDYNVALWVSGDDWAPQEFNIIDISKSTISYDSNGGAGTIASQTKTYGEDLTLSSTKPTRTGYKFLGWSTDKNATTAQYQPSGKYTANKSATLYAIWKINTYTVSYDMNGGTGSIANQTKTYGKDLTLSSTKPTRTGYTFLGWNTDKNATKAQYQPGGKYTANSSAILYAIWKEYEYELSGWTWNGTSSAIANFTCKDDSSQNKTVNATITSETTAATCEKAGKTVYTATAAFEGKNYTDTKEATIPAKGHKYVLTSWNWNGENASAIFTCENDKTHTTTVTANVTSKTEGDTVIRTAAVVLDGQPYTDSKTDIITPAQTDSDSDTSSDKHSDTNNKTSDTDTEQSTDSENASDTEILTDTQTDSDNTVDTESDTETHSDVVIESDSDKNSDMKTSTDTSSDDGSTDSEPTVANDSDTENTDVSTDIKPTDSTDTETETDTSSESDTVPDTDTLTDTNSDTNINSDVDTSDSDSNVPNDSETDTGSDVDSSSDITSDTDTNSDIDTSSDKGSDTESKTDTDIQTDSDTDTSKEVDTETDSDNKPDDQTDTDKHSDTDDQTDTDTPDIPDDKAKGTYGDLDGDGDITANDALMILRASVGMETLTPEQIALADVDGDGDITANDALAVLRYSVGMGDGGNVGKEIA